MRFSLTLAALGVALLAGCVPRTEAPPPVPAPPPAPTPPPVLPPTPAPLVWEDAPLSGGDWRYGAGQGAVFGAAGAPAFILRCEAAQVRLIRAGLASGNALTIRTSTGARALPATVERDGLAATLAASDPLLDAMVFSRGRFAVEAAGAPLLIVPAWPEPARAVEDCRD